MVREVAVVRVLIKHTLTVTWELVVRPGEDLRILRYDEYFGFGVDSGMGCFVDEAGREPLGARYEGRWKAATSCYWRTRSWRPT